MLRLLIAIFKNEWGGLGITQASLVSACADGTGDDSSDAVIKIKRLINEVGPDFCNITNWDFLREDITFNIGTSDYKYSGTSYIPDTYKRTLASYILDNSRRYPLVEVGLQKAYNWYNPNENQGMPEEFCITRPESGYYQIQFNKLPNQTYTPYMDIEKQWTDLTATTSETLITKEYYTGFCHYLKMFRFLQQGDTENYTIHESAWSKPMGMLARLKGLKSKPAKRNQVSVDSNYVDPFKTETGDYARRREYA